MIRRIASALTRAADILDAIRDRQPAEEERAELVERLEQARDRVRVLEDELMELGKKFDAARKAKTSAEALELAACAEADELRAELRRRDEWHDWPPEPCDGRPVEVCTRKREGPTRGRWIQLASSKTHPFIADGSEVVWRELNPAYAPEEGDIKEVFGTAEDSVLLPSAKKGGQGG